LFENIKEPFGENASIESEEPNLDQYVPSDDDLNCEIMETELHFAVFMQNNNKSAGIDGLTAEIFKAAYDILSHLLLNLYNRLFKYSEYPESWGKGIITPIFKKGDINIIIIICT
jgi:hypothetical protein